MARGVLINLGYRLGRIRYLSLEISRLTRILVPHMAGKETAGPIPQCERLVRSAERTGVKIIVPKERF